MKVYRALFAATVVVFNMANFPVLFGKLGFYGRYVLLLPLVLGTLIYATKEHVRIPPGVLAAFYIFITYAFLTTFWTENIALSVIKWVIYVSVVMSLFVGGLIVPRLQDPNPFWPLKWVFIPLVMVSLFALVRGIGFFSGNFRGFAGNSNALAATLVLTSPWLIFELRRTWNDKSYRFKLLALTGLSGVVLLLTFSRAALGTLFLMVTFAGWHMNLGRKFVAAYATIGMLLGIYVVRPQTYDQFYRSYVEKRAEKVLSSRTEQLQDSWEAAKEGGVLGVGFGVSVGTSRYWDMQTFTDFAREKGNTMLAILEELGVIGFILYLALLYSIWGSLRQLSRAPDPESKFLYKLALGFFFGALFHSAFEAWFLSSGPDVATYWSTMGLFIGAMTLRFRKANERFHRMETAVGARVFVPSSSPRG